MSAASLTSDAPPLARPASPLAGSAHAQGSAPEYYKHPAIQISVRGESRRWQDTKSSAVPASQGLHSTERPSSRGGELFLWHVNSSALVAEKFNGTGVL